MPKNDEKLRGLSCKNKGGAYRREGTFEDEEFVLQYLRSILQAANKVSARNLKGYPQGGHNE